MNLRSDPHLLSNQYPWSRHLFERYLTSRKLRVLANAWSGTYDWGVIVRVESRRIGEHARPDEGVAHALVVWTALAL